HSPALVGVSEVVLRGHGTVMDPETYGADRLQSLLTWRGAASIRHLGMFRAHLDGDALAELVGAELPALTSLEVTECVFYPVGATEAMINVPRWLGQLERFALIGMPTSVTPVLDLIPPGRLRQLVLRRCGLTDATAARLAAHRLVRGL